MQAERVPLTPPLGGVRRSIRHGGTCAPSRNHLVTASMFTLLLLVATVSLAATLPPGRSAGHSMDACLGSPSRVHARCKLTVHFRDSCKVVEPFMQARLDASHDCKSNPGTYRGSLQDGTRTTGDGKYTDRFRAIFTPVAGGGCAMTACSESQVTSVIDYSTNFCNLYNLYGNSSSPLAFTESYDACMQHDVNKCCR